MSAQETAAPLGARRLQDFCKENKLPAPEYELVGDTGPQLTLRAAVGRHERRATASTEEAARQLAADQLYNYLRENLAQLTKDCVEVKEEELVRAPEKMMERPDRGQLNADNLGKLTYIDEDKRNAAIEALGRPEVAGDEEAAVRAAAAALGLSVKWSALPAFGGGSLPLLELVPTMYPQLAFAGRSRARAAAVAARYLRRALGTANRLASAGGSGN